MDRGFPLSILFGFYNIWFYNGSIIYSVDGNKNAFKVVRLRGLMLLSAPLFFIWKICQ